MPLPADSTPLDVLVVGAGFAGSVCARVMAEDYGLRVLVIDRRPHVAGNAHDAPDEHGVLIHTYGPHIFHTNADKVTRQRRRHAMGQRVTGYEYGVLDCERTDRRQRSGEREHPFAQVRVQADAFELRRAERSPLVPNRVRDTEPPEVVNI